MNRRCRKLDDVYRKNSESGAFIIEVALDRYEDIFNEWDPAPFKRRDIEPDLWNYLEGCGRQIPEKTGIELHFDIPESARDKQKEDRVREGLATYFQNEMESAGNKLRRLYFRTLLHLLIAVLLLFLISYLGRIPDSALWFQAIREGMTIGAWVFTWEAISTFFFGSYKTRRNVRLNRRFSVMPVYFEYLPKEGASDNTG